MGRDNERHLLGLETRAVSSWRAVGEGLLGLKRWVELLVGSAWKGLALESPGSYLPVEGAVLGKVLRWHVLETRQSKREAVGWKEAVRGRRGR